MKVKKALPGDAYQDNVVLTPLERELLDGLAEIIAADILRVRAYDESHVDGNVHDDAQEVTSC